MLQDLDKKITSSGSGKDMPVKPQGLRGMPAGIWVLGLVSLLMDISSEMIHSLLPLFMVTVLATSATTVGIIEGLAEATALIVKVFSGVLSDWLGRRKGLAVIGYGLGALTKPLFARGRQLRPGADGAAAGPCWQGYSRRAARCAGG